MKTLWNLNRYYILQTIHNQKLLAPLMLSIIITAIFYYSPTAFAVSCFPTTALILFSMQGWITFIFQKEDLVEEQLLYIKTPNKNIYYISKYVFLCLCGCILGLFMTLYPTLLHIIKGGQFFQDAFSFSILLEALLLHILSVMSATVLISLLHPRIYKDRKAALPIAALIILLVVVQSHISDAYPWLRIPLYVLPPIAPLNLGITELKAFSFSHILPYALAIIIYCLCYSAIGIYIHKKRKFQ